MSKSWISLETHIRDLASILFNCNFKADRIDGVNYDAVGYPSEEEMVILETTEENNLNKIRTDVAKIASLKLLKAAESIIVRALLFSKKNQHKAWSILENHIRYRFYLLKVSRPKLLIIIHTS